MSDFHSPARALVTVLLAMAPASLHAQLPNHTSDAARRAPYQAQTNEDLQPTTLPALPYGMTVQMLVEGDRLFHGRGGCFACHGTEGQGLPAAGDAITSSLAYARHEWRSIDSLITAGMPDVLSRSPIAMPARGARGDLTAAESERLAAYVWAISAVRGEPWPGGHPSHAGLVPAGSTKGTAPAKPVRVRSQVPTPSRGQVTGTARSANHAPQPRR